MPSLKSAILTGQNFRTTSKLLLNRLPMLHRSDTTTCDEQCGNGARHAGSGFGHSVKSSSSKPLTPQEDYHLVESY